MGYRRTLHDSGPENKSELCKIARRESGFSNATSVGAAAPAQVVILLPPCDDGAACDHHDADVLCADAMLRDLSGLVSDSCVPWWFRCLQSRPECGVGHG
jgi:hypothetical protein